MPAQPARVWDVRRPASILNHSKYKTDQCGNYPEPGHPQNDLPPELRLCANRAEIEPVRDCRDPCHGAAAPRREDGNLSCLFRDVKLRMVGIIDREFVQ